MHKQKFLFSRLLKPRICMSTCYTYEVCIAIQIFVIFKWNVQWKKAFSYFLSKLIRSWFFMKILLIFFQFPASTDGIRIHFSRFTNGKFPSSWKVLDRDFQILICQTKFRKLAEIVIKGTVMQIEKALKMIA